MNQEYIDTHGGIKVAQKHEVKNSIITLFHFVWKKPIIILVNLGSASPALCCNAAEVTDILCKERKGFFTTLSARNSRNCFSQSKKHNKSFTKNRFSLYILEHTITGTAKPCALLTAHSSRQFKNFLLSSMLWSHYSFMLQTLGENSTIRSRNYHKYKADSKKTVKLSLPITELCKLNANPPQNKNIRAANPLFANAASATQSRFLYENPGNHYLSRLTL